MRGRRLPRQEAGKVMTTAPILVVEDNSATRKLMRVTLNAEGYSVLEAEDGQTALDLAAGREPAMVLLDCKLPDMDGFEVGRRLLARDNSCQPRANCPASDHSQECFPLRRAKRCCLVPNWPTNLWWTCPRQA